MSTFYTTVNLKYVNVIWQLRQPLRKQTSICLEWRTAGEHMWKVYQQKNMHSALLKTSIYTDLLWHHKEIFFFFKTDVSPCHRLELVKELGLHHGDLVDDEVSTAGPVLQHAGPLSQLDALLQRGRAGADAWTETGGQTGTQMNNTSAKYSIHTLCCILRFN